MPEPPSHVRWMRTIYSSAVPSLIIAFILASLSAAGIIALDLAYALLIAAFLIGSTGIYLAQPLWGIAPAKRITIWLASSLILGCVLLLIGHYERSTVSQQGKEIEGLVDGVKALLTTSAKDAPKSFTAPPPELMKPARPLSTLRWPPPSKTSPLKSKTVTAPKKKEQVGNSTTTVLESPPKAVNPPVPTQTTMALGRMKFAATSPIVVESGTSFRIRLKVTVAIVGELQLGATDRTVVEYYNEFSQWELITSHVTCKGDPSSINRASYSLLPGTDATQYVEFICPRAVVTGESATLRLILKVKSSSEDGLFEYSFGTPPIQ